MDEGIKGWGWSPTTLHPRTSLAGLPVAIQVDANGVLQVHDPSPTTMIKGENNARGIAIRLGSNQSSS